MAEAKLVEVREENVLIQAGSCALTLSPLLGGKIASIRLGDLELLQAPLSAYAPRTRTMAFDAGDASGWDECLPSVAECVVQAAAGPAEVPDHGDLWRVVWQTDNTDKVTATMVGECFSLPLRLTRTVTLSESDRSWNLDLLYKVTNAGNHDVPWSWAAHPLFSVDAGDRIVLPDSITELRLEGSGRKRLGPGGTTVSWPIATLANGSRTDLRVAQPPESNIGDKLFAGPLTAVENWCALERPDAGVKITIHFDPAATPYLGLWICYGGWPDKPGPKQMCVALEPATAPVDSLAITGPWSRTLAPGESFEWPMHVQIELT